MKLKNFIKKFNIIISVLKMREHDFDKSKIIIKDFQNIDGIMIIGMHNKSKEDLMDSSNYDEKYDESFMSCIFNEKDNIKVCFGCCDTINMNDGDYEIGKLYYK